VAWVCKWPDYKARFQALVEGLDLFVCLFVNMLRMRNCQPDDGSAKFFRIEGFQESHTA
jgi:hypothetical protein